MINRIFIRTAITNYVDYYCLQAFVTFKGLEPKTKLRLLALGYCPAIEIWDDWNKRYVPLGISVNEFSS